jgi:hypothetical protein
MVQAYHASKTHFKSSMNESLNLQKKMKNKHYQINKVKEEGRGRREEKSHYII